MYNLIQGDCLKEMDKLISNGTKVDLILTDPPYGTTACKWDTIIPFEEMWERINQLVKTDGCVALFGSEPFSSFLRCSNIKNYSYDWVWNKIVGANFLHAKRQPLKIHELISIFNTSVKMPTYYPQMVAREKPIYKGKYDRTEKKNAIPISNTEYSKNFESKKIEYTEKFPVSILEFSNKKNKGLHPTQKPVALLEYLIKTYTNEGDTVLDFTMGSGSTGVACLNTSRNFIGIELDQKYYNIAKSRLQEAEK